MNMNPIKSGGCYELPPCHPRQEETGANFLLVSRYNGGSYSCYFFSVMPAMCDMKACVCQDQIELGKSELQSIVDHTIAKHGDCLDLRLKKSGDYQVRAGHNNAVLENSNHLQLGKYKMHRDIPSVRGLEFQGSTDTRTQIAKGVFVE